MGDRRGWQNWGHGYPPSGAGYYQPPPPEANGWGREVASRLTAVEIRTEALDERADKHGTEIDLVRAQLEQHADHLEQINARRAWLSSLPWAQLSKAAAAAILGAVYILKTGLLPPLDKLALLLAGGVPK